MQKRLGLAGIAFGALLLAPGPADAAACRDVLEVFATAVKTRARDDALAQLAPIADACPEGIAAKARHAYGAMLLREVDDMSARGAGDDRIRPLVEQAAKHGGLWDAWWRLADLDLRIGRYAAAHHSFRQAIERLDSLAELPADHLSKTKFLRNRAEETYLLASTAGQGADLKAPQDVRCRCGCCHATRRAISVLFGNGSIALGPAARRELDALAARLRTAETPVIRIVGHTDGRGPDARNLAISKRRAEAVARYLTSAGVAARYDIVGQGKREPRPIEQTDIYPRGAIDILNRRVDITWDPS
ncbi:OmpA family protein [Prosthecodimorpha staleyi]|uniref:OmpA family protein n=1 Tax=Prosthecodimorpha staleyi TaxID=2840188 RepID=A0A947GJV8_9HYPH|nr:OmpA family protein [Prosthecodimorpha staleyi]MBT9292519.1 OmpA family protein [Prosthecodimorpha staleyi]